MRLKTKIIFGFLLISILSCNINEVKKLDNSLKKTIKENNCQIEAKIIQKNENKDLMLRILNSSDSLMIYGKILLDFYDNSNNEKLYFDNYSISAVNDLLILKISRDQMFNIANKKKIYDQDLNELCLEKNDKFLNKLNSFMINQIDTAEFRKFIVSYDFNLKNKFEGFSISENKYISFSSVMDKRKIIITYSLEDFKNTVFAFAVY